MSMAIARKQTRVSFSHGAIEALKYLALVSMVVDHMNKVFFASSLAWAIPLGRLAFPIFACVVAYNLARPNADYMKSLRRLVIVALIATPFHPVITGGAWLPLNVLATFAVAVLVIVCIEEAAYSIAAAIFFIGALFVDYQWAGVGLVVSTWWYFRRGTPILLVVMAASLIGVCVLVGNAWSIFAIPVIVVAQYWSPALPRLRWFFWAFYPLHLAVLFVIQRSV